MSPDHMGLGVFVLAKVCRAGVGHRNWPQSSRNITWCRVAHPSQVWQEWRELPGWHVVSEVACFMVAIRAPPLWNQHIHLKGPHVTIDPCISR